MQRSAKLLDDTTFVTAQAMQSTFPGKYHSSFQPHMTFSPSCTAFPGGCRSYPSAEAGRRFAKPTRPNIRPETELFGTSAFKGRGDAHLTPGGVELASRLRIGEGLRAESCSMQLSETDYDRWECVSAPLKVEASGRGGVPTRMGLQYFSPQC